MPKMKSHRGAAKRLRLTGGGKLRREKANKRHYLEHKPSTRTRRLSGAADVAPADRRRARRLLGI